MGGAGPALHYLFPPRQLVHSDSDSDEEDTQFFSMASGAPQTPAPESSHRQAQSTFSTLVTVLKGRITALCDAKVSSSCPARQACQHHIRNRDGRKLRGLAAPIATVCLPTQITLQPSRLSATFQPVSMSGMRVPPASSTWRRLSQVWEELELPRARTP